MHVASTRIPRVPGSCPCNPIRSNLRPTRSMPHAALQRVAYAPHRIVQRQPSLPVANGSTPNRQDLRRPWINLLHVYNTSGSTYIGRRSMSGSTVSVLTVVLEIRFGSRHACARGLQRYFCPKACHQRPNPRTALQRHPLVCGSSQTQPREAKRRPGYSYADITQSGLACRSMAKILVTCHMGTMDEYSGSQSSRTPSPPFKAGTVSVTVCSVACALRVETLKGCQGTR
ncbi:hypothetical protein OH77DRAFT_502237 [Trametes cingulata]|nr:hypothetical protein OH77DRAFT_502237 [Trametes cingulata]